MTCNDDLMGSHDETTAIPLKRHSEGAVGILDSRDPNMEDTVMHKP